MDGLGKWIGCEPLSVGRTAAGRCLMTRRCEPCGCHLNEPRAKSICSALCPAQAQNKDSCSNYPIGERTLAMSFQLDLKFIPRLD